ncbi:hypothetical protein [Schaalia sp. Marseille-Q2122]|uniref:hypothetical protein n=1 Tax=Schaalia sp. Marseille-Q2122 TaxID=2736604 RepID=UPI00158CE230|nr:hypothetical protein [Schaalia sp. Marseille-Q2122]
MRSEEQIIDDIVEFTDGAVAPLQLSGLDTWLGVWTYMLSLLTQRRIALPLDLKEDFMRVIASQLDDYSNRDDEEWDLENARADYIEYLSITPPVENFCAVWKPNTDGL